MDDKTLEQRIALWKAMPVDARGNTDEFIDALVAKIEDLEHKIEELKYESYGDDL